MIEDDLRTILADELDCPVYARLVPPLVADCVTVQELGGASTTNGIRRAYHRVSVMAVSEDRTTALIRLRQARNALIVNIPAEVNGTYYYTAMALADGSLKTREGRRFIEYTDMEVVAGI